MTSASEDLLAEGESSPVPLKFPLPYLLITIDVASNIWAFYFKGSGFLYLLLWHFIWFHVQVAYCIARTAGCSAHAAENAFWLSSKVVTLHMDNSAGKAYLFNQSGTSYLLFFRLAYCILNLTDKYGITHYSSIHTYQSQCESWLSIIEKVGSQVASSSSHCPGCVYTLRSTRGKSASILTYKSMSGSQLYL